MRSLMSHHRLLCSAVVFCFAAAAQAQVPFTVETEAIPTATAGDLAIVVDRSDAGRPPMIAAGDPIQNGLYVYHLDGGLLQIVPYGAMRGVDSRTDLAFQTAPSTLVATAAAITQEVVFGAPVDGGLIDVTSAPVQVPTASALTLHRKSNGQLELIADDSAGNLRRFSVDDDGAGKVVGTSTGNLQLPGVPSSLVVDDRTGTLYAAIPNSGLYRVGLTLGSVDVLVPLDGGQFNGLVAGLTFYPLFDGGGLLLTTVAGLDEVTVHELAGPLSANYVTRFTVERGAEVVRQPRYVDVVPNRLPGFDAGLFVIHDTAGANYKLVPWEVLASSTPVPLPIHVPEDFGLDAGLPDAGQGDGGEVFADGGTGDGGLTDGGRPDGGGGTGGSGGGPGPQPVEEGCHCSQVDPLIFPALWGLWIFARSRRRRTGVS
ncbi:MAG: hypothetical protein AMXMBFR34_51790 [Myxococcaceae bacterium]